MLPTSTSENVTDKLPTMEQLGDVVQHSTTTDFLLKTGGKMAGRYTFKTAMATGGAMLGGPVGGILAGASAELLMNADYSDIGKSMPDQTVDDELANVLINNVTLQK